MRTAWNRSTSSRYSGDSKNRRTLAHFDVGTITFAASARTRSINIRLANSANAVFRLVGNDPTVDPGAPGADIKALTLGIRHFF